MREKQEKFLYEKELKALSRAGVDYAVCGGLAVVLYGYVRFTADLDLVVNLNSDNLEKLYNVLAQLKYRCRVPIKKDEFTDGRRLKDLAKQKNAKVISFYNLDDNFRIIDVGIDLPDSQQILKNKKFIEANDFAIPTIYIDDLIKMKEGAGRRHDLTDVENLKKIKKAN